MARSRGTLSTRRSRAHKFGGGIPFFRRAEAGSEAANILVITMSRRMDDSIVPATSSFTVNDGAVNTVTNVAISNRSITLTLTNNVEIGDVITVAYTKPGSNPLQDNSGNEAESWTAQSVTNSLGNYLRDHDGDTIDDHDTNPIQIT